MNIEPAPAPRTLKLKGITAAIFDFNGTILDDEHAHFNAFKDAVAQTSGNVLTWNTYQTLCQGKTDLEGAENLTAGNLSPENPETLVRIKQHSYEKHSKNQKLIPGILKLTETLHRNGVNLHIVTASDNATVETTLQQNPFPSFASIHTETPTRYRQATLLNIAKTARFVTHTGVVFDDSPANIASAKSLGFRVVSVGANIPLNASAAAKTFPAYCSTFNVIHVGNDFSDFRIEK